MATIPKGFQLALITPSGEVADTIELEGYDLARTYARVDLAAKVYGVIGKATGSYPSPTGQA